MNDILVVKQNTALETEVERYLDSPASGNLDAVVEAGSRLVYHFAACYSLNNVSRDLIQAGYEGLLKALKNFQRDKGAAFATYAAHCIMGEIRHFLRKETHYYRPGCIMGLQDKAGQIIEQYYVQNGEIPEYSYIAKNLNIKEEGVSQLMQAGLVSLDELDVGKIRCLKYESFRLPIEDKILLGQALDKLSELNRKVICLLFFKGYTQEQAAAALGINQRKVSRLMHSGLKDMRKNMEEDRGN